MSSTPLRILFLTYQGDLAGSTHSIAYLAKGLTERGHFVAIGLRKESLLWSMLEGSKVVRIEMKFGGKFDFKNWKQIRDAVQKHQIQLINAQSSHDRYTSIFANWRYKLGVKIVHTRRQMPESMGGPIQLYLYNKRTDGIVAVSQQVKDGLVKLGMKDSHIKVIHNGTPSEKYEHIDEDKVKLLKQKFNITDDDFVIGCISRPKNQEQIFVALQQIEKPVKMIFGGIPKTEAYAVMAATIENKHEVFFEGDIPNSEVLNYYKIFDIKVLASTMEGLSQSLLEAMALGTPVTATAYAGNLDLIQNGENGLLFEDRDTVQLAANIEKLRADKNLRERLSKAGKITALETYNIENTISNYESYFQKLITDGTVQPE